MFVKKWIRVVVLTAAGVLLFSTAGAAAEKTMNGKKPNVVVVLCDQLGSFHLGCYGNTFIKTPHIDGLAANGFRFELSVTDSPVCTPARSNLMSGQYARTCVGSRANEMGGSNRALGREDRLKFPDKTLPEAFKDLGYKTAHIGKWHIDTTPLRLGFDLSLVTEGSIFTRARFSENEGPMHHVPGFSTDYEIHKVRKFFAEEHEEPFFLYYNIISPHMPVLDVPYKYSRMYDPAEVPLRKNVWKDGELPSDEQWFHLYMWQVYNPDYPPITARATPDFTIRDLTALFYGSVTWVDDTLGEIMASLRANGLEEDTIVLFTSDHGDMLGSHHLWNKDCLYEESIRVPVIYQWPGRIKTGVNEGQVTSLIDVMPTLLDLCGGEIPESVQGRSMAPFLLGTNTEATLENNFAFIETPYGELGIRTPTHLYGVGMDEKDQGIANKGLQFYDLTKDPYQQNNLIGSGEQAEVAAALLERLQEWDKATPRLKTHAYMPWQEVLWKTRAKERYDICH
jgi:arylsulfatase A-like enzyme